MLPLAASAGQGTGPAARAALSRPPIRASTRWLALSRSIRARNGRKPRHAVEAGRCRGTPASCAANASNGLHPGLSAGIRSARCN
jgi:hypothetical protein